MVLAGEEHKSIHSAELVLRQLAQADAERGDLVVAGRRRGGRPGGFCAVYQRGMRHVQVPTTVVAQVDSAGGKTGVDLPEGKNYVGAYHQPAAVLCDPATLDTLPEEDTFRLRRGRKSALIAGGSLWRACARAVLWTPRSSRAACGGRPPVAEDERDAGRRQVLNLGHTVGHAIEAATDTRALRHGGPWASGCCGASLLGPRGLRREVAALLEARDCRRLLRRPA